MLCLSFIFVHDDPLFFSHYCAYIVLSDPRSNMDLSIKILGFHTAMSCQDVKLHSVPLQTNVILVPLIFMHLRLVFCFFFAWTVIKGILELVLQPCKPKQLMPLPAAVLLEMNTSKPAFLLSFFFLFTSFSCSRLYVLTLKRFRAICTLVWSCSECFKKSLTCFLVHAPDTHTHTLKKTFPSSHLNGGVQQIHHPLSPPPPPFWMFPFSSNQSTTVHFVCPACF